MRGNSKVQRLTGIHRSLRLPTRLLLAGLTAVMSLGMIAVAQSPASAARICRDATSTITGAKATATICWDGTDAWLTGRIYDTRADSHKANLLVHYARNVSGTWRPFTASAGDTGGLTYPASRSASWSGSPVKDVWIKACRENTLDQVCDGTWR